MALSQPPIMPPELMSRLHGLRVHARKMFSGQMKGERRSRHRGSSVEFADFREYAHGDDPRFVDWSMYGRLERLYIKLFLEEEDLCVYVLVDTSASMGFGSPTTKLHRACSLGAALSYVAAAGLDRVSLSAFSTTVGPELRAKRGRSATQQIIQYLQQLTTGGATSLEDSVRRFLLSMPKAGLVIVLSDFLDPQGYTGALSRLLERGCDVFAVQILSGEELRPELQGDLRLVDAETGMETELTMTPAAISAYRQTLQNLTDGLATWCRARGAGSMLADTTEPLESQVLRGFRRAGLLK